MSCLIEGTEANARWKKKSPLGWTLAKNEGRMHRKY
jgi:hypothetical protein